MLIRYSLLLLVFHVFIWLGFFVCFECTISDRLDTSRHFLLNNQKMSLFFFSFKFLNINSCKCFSYGLTLFQLRPCLIPFPVFIQCLPTAERNEFTVFSASPRSQQAPLDNQTFTSAELENGQGNNTKDGRNTHDSFFFFLIFLKEGPRREKTGDSVRWPLLRYVGYRTAARIHLIINEMMWRL